MDLEQVVTLDPSDPAQFTPEHKTFLDANKDQLTTQELQKFGYSVEPVKPVARSTPAPAPEIKPKEGEDTPDEEVVKIHKAVNEALEPERKRSREFQDKVELDTLIASRPEFSPYRASIENHLKDPAYANIPVDRIAAMVASNDLMKLGARRERAAQAKADATKHNANGGRKDTGSQEPDWRTAPREQFLAKRAEIMGQSR